MLIPCIPKLAAYVDRLFVKSFGLPVNIGAAFFLARFMLGLLLPRAYRPGKGKGPGPQRILCSPPS